LAAASFLKSVSHASKLPVPQDAASTGTVGTISTALTANALKRSRGISRGRTEIALLLKNEWPEP
jgi:hypothetical protein